MDDVADRRAWAVLARTPGLDVRTLQAALAQLDGPAALTCRAGLQQTSGLRPKARAFLASSAAASRVADERWLEGEHHHLLPFNDPRFPSSLLQLRDCPVVVHVAGRLEELRQPQVAIVGTRNPSPQGRDIARGLARQLAVSGLAVTSGVAEGIDACAHRGALEGGGFTVGVLGNGLDVVYPRCNRPLYAQIERQGALLSEFPLGSPPRVGNFPRRNRLIAVLSLGTLVVEATLRSGSLITARLANDHGRAVFAVPGSIHNPHALGCHELIRQGAKLCASATDILQELNFSSCGSNHLDPPGDPATAPETGSGMDKDHKILLDALGFDPVDVDTLVVRTGFKPEAVSSMMLILELEGHVQAARGGRYSRVAHRRAGGER